MILKESVIDNWGDALKNIAVKENKIDEFIKQGTMLIDLLKDRDDFVKILATRVKGFKAQQLIIIDETFTQNGINQYLINAMKILVESSAFTYTRAIFKNMRKKLLILHNEVYGVVWSTVELKKSDIEIMEQKISAKLKRQVKLVNKIDKKLIGGAQIIVANTIYDGSIKGKLDQLRYEAITAK